MKKLIPVLMALLGTGAGVGAGLALRPGAESTDGGAEPVCAAPEHPETALPAAAAGEGPHDYVKLNNQFVVPLVENGRVDSLVILSLSLEVGQGGSETVYAVEPKLRDAFLQVLFNHANAGGFAGTFTESTAMTVLRDALLEVARKTIGAVVSDVLIVDIVRQDS